RRRWAGTRAPARRLQPPSGSRSRLSSAPPPPPPPGSLGAAVSGSGGRRLGVRRRRRAGQHLGEGGVVVAGQPGEVGFHAGIFGTAPAAVFPRGLGREPVPREIPREPQLPRGLRVV